VGGGVGLTGGAAYAGGVIGNDSVLGTTISIPNASGTVASLGGFFVFGNSAIELSWPMGL
jgi:hypothetical protein